MKFKRTFNVFIDNFSTTYRLLLYKIIVSVIFSCVVLGIAYPIISNVTGSEVFSNILASIRDFFLKLINGEAADLGAVTEQIKADFEALLSLIRGQQTRIIISTVAIILIYLVQKFFQGIGHYTAASLINDKMALHADSPFMTTLIKNLGKASIYNLVYVPLSFVYDVCSMLIGYLLLFCLTFIPLLLRIYITVVVMLLIIVIKMVFTTDWLPAMICGKKGNGAAMAHTFARKGKHTGSVLSNYVIFVLLIMAANVGALFLTIGAGLLITVPASYIVLICFQFVNYCDDNEILYFSDKNTIVKPDKVKPVSREDFFRGEH